MKIVSLYKNIYYILIIVSISTIDYIVKNIIFNNFHQNQIFYINKFINIKYLHNYGISLGLLNYKNNFYYIFFLVFYLIIFIKTIKIIFIFDICFSIIVGGIIGNILDRIIHGFIIDFIDLHIYQLHIPIFNLADLFIFTGTIIKIINLLLKKEREFK
ncbi:Lipoprotein signal peptidase [Buchnera aphidicola (Neophyllaphis podocarpi)]|uniref:signal peptidase II n=1 Tax=Buchnera aphidicola TaxID=9 RepID=UPI003463BE1B